MSRTARIADHRISCASVARGEPCTSKGNIAAVGGTDLEETHVTPPPYYGQQPPAAPGNDKVTLWGVLGIVFAICCWPLGIVFGVLGLLEARKVGKPPTLA